MGLTQFGGGVFSKADRPHSFVTWLIAETCKIEQKTKVMKVYPLLFDLAAPKPTTREVADRVKQFGTEQALPDAAHLADGATYQEVTCRSALTPVKGMPFGWTLNPYRGCTH